MTHLDRALSKTYGVSLAAAPPATGIAGAAETLRGWVGDLRTPRPPSRRQSGPTIPPAWAWPAICNSLLNASGPGFRRLADQLLAARASRNLQSIAFCGAGRTAGTTSVVLSLAKLFHEGEAAKIVLIDADLGQPPLADQLGRTSQAGQSPIAGKRLPKDFTLLCLDDPRLLLLSPPPGTPQDDSLPIIAGHLRNTIHGLRSRLSRCTTPQNESHSPASGYQGQDVNSPATDIILVDAGPWDGPLAPWLLDRSAIDGLVYVERSGYGRPESENPGRACFRANIEFLGTIETFTNDKHESCPPDAQQLFEKGGQAAGHASD